MIVKEKITNGEKVGWGLYPILYTLYPESKERLCVFPSC